MHVVGHQYVGVDTATGLACVFTQPVEVIAVVLVSEEAGPPVVAALDDVQGNVRQRQASSARHGSQYFTEPV